MNIDEIEEKHDEAVAESMDFTKYHADQQTICNEHIRWLASLQRESKLIEMVRDIEAEKGINERSFDLRWEADILAIKRWREATGKEMIWPDHADLCVWLMDKITQLEADKAGLVEALNHVLIDDNLVPRATSNCRKVVQQALANYGSMKK